MNRSKEPIIVPQNIVILEEIISNASNVPIMNIRSRYRLRRYVEARAAIWYIAHDQMGYSYPHLALIYERDHSTIMNSVKRMRKNGAIKKILRGVERINPDLLKKQKGGRLKRPVSGSMEDWKF